MCLSIAVNHPDRVLAKGEHLGFEWLVTNNGMGSRCGYVRVPKGHPWHGQGYDELADVDAHGGLTFAAPAVECGAGDAKADPRCSIYALSRTYLSADEEEYAKINKALSLIEELKEI